MEQPSVELRFQNLHIETSLYSESGRNLPTIFNAYRNAFEVSIHPQWHSAVCMCCTCRVCGPRAPVFLTGRYPLFSADQGAGHLRAVCVHQGAPAAA